MNLNVILNDINYEIVKGNIDVDVSDICYDSRKVKDGSLFVALIGASSDGHDYIEMAINNGASVIVVEKDVEVDSDVTVIKVSNTRRILSRLAINYYGNPSSELVMIGITGTKGKTTTASMIKNILEEDGKSVGLIGTLGVIFNDKYYGTVNTTPESLDIQKYLREMALDGVKYAIMEVSSQALKVGRVDGMKFDYGVFTNLTQDHIGEDEHPNMEDYIYSKSMLFNMCEVGVFNIDDSHYNDMVERCTCNINTFGHNNDANLVIDNVVLLRNKNFLGIEVSTSGNINDKFLINTPGEFSAYNGVCAILVTHLMGCSIDSIKKALAKVAVKGRMEIVPVSDSYSVIIDYAHNGISIKSVLETMRAYNPKRIVSLFGCGGNRSKDRRYDMGEISGNLADFTIVTEDNSRFEDVEDIMKDIEVGLSKTNGKYIKIADRTEAIRYALDNAMDGDIILLLGKGHETYQDREGIRVHYDEREVIAELIK